MWKNVEKALEMQPADFIKHLTEIKACPCAVSMSEATWNLLLKPLYEQKPTPANGNSKLAEILFEAATALNKAQRNGATFEVAGEAVGGMSAAKAMLEVMFVGEKEAPTMEIGIAGEWDLARHPEKLEKTDTPPVYFTLDTIGNCA